MFSLPNNQPSWKQLKTLIKFPLNILIGLSLVLLITLPTLAAQQIIFVGPIQQITIPMTSLDSFAKTGKLDDNLAFLNTLTNPQQQKDIRQILQKPFKTNPRTLSQFSQTNIGNTAFTRLGQVIQTGSSKNGGPALKTAFNKAVTAKGGLTVMNMLRQFPETAIKLDLFNILNAVSQLTQIFANQPIMNNIIREAVPNVGGTINGAKNLKEPGSFKWNKQRFNYYQPDRKANLVSDLYLPQGLEQPSPVIVIYHGLASNRTTFAYLAKHLASYGFTIGVLEDPQTNSQQIGRFIDGLGSAPPPQMWANRPRDIKFFLDELAKKSQTNNWKIDTNNVGVLGQSLGGYTVLATGGAPVNISNLKGECAKGEKKPSFNLSEIFQCGAAKLPKSSYNLTDPRIKAIIAVNPVNGGIFSPSDIGNIKIPTMIIAGTNDLFAPAISEQIYPFSWLTSSNKYLLLMNQGTHFSFLAGENTGTFAVPQDLIGPDPQLAFPILEALSTIFFKTYISQDPEYQRYLNQGYIQSLNVDPFSLHLIESLNQAQIDKAIAS